MSFFNRLLAHPLTRDLPVDDPRTTLLRRKIILEKSFLKNIYSEWYRCIIDALPKKERVLEIGSGAGFFSEFLPQVITSEVFHVPEIDLVANACALPLQRNSLDAIVMTDVFHHIPSIRRFFSEATRCIRPGGRIAMIEPWRTPWSEWIYVNFHPEPFDPNSDWDIPATGPLSGANGALPWIVFQRDREIFAAQFPLWRIVDIKLMMPFSYLLSGGVSLRSMIPGWAYRTIRAAENNFENKRWAMFAMIVLERRS